MGRSHHWEGETPDPDKYYGFLYIITNEVTGTRYIGRKFYHKYRKRKKAGESDWRRYTGSCKKLNEDIKELGKSHFKFEIFKQYETRGGLVYYETHYQHAFDVLTAKDEDGNRLWYNGNIGAVKFIPPEVQSPETIAKRVESLKGQKRTPEQRKAISERMLGNNRGAVPCSEEKRRKISKANTGKKRTPEQRAAASAARKGKPSPVRGARWRALEAGETSYEGRECKKCGTRRKSTSNGSCHECARRRHREKKTCHSTKTQEERNAKTKL